MWVAGLQALREARLSCCRCSFIFNDCLPAAECTRLATVQQLQIGFTSARKDAAWETSDGSFGQSRHLNARVRDKKMFGNEKNLRFCFCIVTPRNQKQLASICTSSCCEYTSDLHIITCCHASLTAGGERCQHVLPTGAQHHLFCHERRRIEKKLPMHGIN